MKRSERQFFIEDQFGNPIVEEDDEDRILKQNPSPGSIIYRLSDKKPLYRRDKVRIQGIDQEAWIVIP